MPATNVEVFFSRVCLVKTVNVKRIRIFAQNVLILALLAPGLPAVHAGFITYGPGVGGTFEPGSENTFTLSTYEAGTLFPDVDYESARVFFRWGGAIPMDAFASENIAVGTGSFSTDTRTNASKSNAFVDLESQVIREVLSDATSSFKIPTLAGNEGWYLEAATHVSDNGLTDDARSVQRLNTKSIFLIPEPSSLVLVGLGFGIAAFRGRRKFLKSAIVKPGIN